MPDEDFENALEGGDEVELTVTGRRSGRTSTRPVWYVLDHHRVLLIPVTGTQSQWFKNILANPQVRLRIDGNSKEATAQPHTDPATVESAVEKFRHKYGASDIRRYYSTLNAAVEVPL